MKTFKEIQDEHVYWLKAKQRFKNKTVLEGLALVASEVGEAVNECRMEKPSPEFGSELADIVLRVVGVAAENDIDLEAEIIAKMEVNKNRGTRGRVI